MGFWEVRGVGALSLSCLSISHVGFEGGVKLFQGVGEGSDLRVRGGLFRTWGNDCEERGMEAVVRVEGTNSERFGDSILAGKV